MHTEDVSSPQAGDSRIARTEKLTADDLHLEVQVETQGKERLDLSYQFTNRSTQAVVLINVVSTDASKKPADPNPVRVTQVGDDSVRIGQFGLGRLSPTFPPLYSFTLVSPGASYRNRLSATLSATVAGKTAEFCLGVVPAAAVAGIRDLQLQEGTPVTQRTGTTLGEQQVLVCRPLPHLG